MPLFWLGYLRLGPESVLTNRVKFEGILSMVWKETHWEMCWMVLRVQWKQTILSVKLSMWDISVESGGRQITFLRVMEEN